MDHTAGILIIGNEILSGKIPDDNAPFLCRELNRLGVEVQVLAVIPDIEAVIAEHIRSWAGRYRLIFTCGGVGPTHDDVTVAGVACGLGKKIVRDGSLLELIQKIYPQSPTEAVLKLAEVPEGSELIMAEGLRYPVIAVSNIYIFPGIPDILKKKFNALRERFRSTPFNLKKIFLRFPEMDIAHYLFTVNARYPALKLGSYPSIGNPEYQVMLTLESKDQAYLNQAYQHLVSMLPREAIIRVEEG